MSQIQPSWTAAENLHRSPALIILKAPGPFEYVINNTDAGFGQLLRRLQVGRFVGARCPGQLLFRLQSDALWCRCFGQLHCRLQSGAL